MHSFITHDKQVLDYRYKRHDKNTVNFFIGHIFLGNITKSWDGEYTAIPFRNRPVAETICGFRTRFRAAQYLIQVCMKEETMKIEQGNRMTKLTEDNTIPIDTNTYISIEMHNVLISKLVSEMYVVIGSLYTSNGEVSDSTYESLLDKMMDIINNPSILQSDKDLLVPIK
jgi:hypothetical protein